MEAIGGFAVFIMVLAVFAVIFIAKSVRVVPQQEAWVVERFGKFHTVLQPGLNFIIPIIDRVAYRQTLKEIPMDTSSQICITKDNTQLQVDGVLYFQVTNPELASYGTSDFVMAITQLAQTSLRSVIGTMSLDKTFEEREEINARVVQAVDEAAQTWGVKVLRYEIKDLTPPKEILRAMQLQITAEREKRAVIATSEGQKQKEINIAEGERAAMIAQSEGENKPRLTRRKVKPARLKPSPRLKLRPFVPLHRLSASRKACRPSICKSRKSTWKLSEKLLRKVIRCFFRPISPTWARWSLQR